MKKPSKNISNQLAEILKRADLDQWDQEIAKILLSFPFSNQSRAVSNISSLLHESEEFLKISDKLFEHLFEGADPDRALNNFERFMKVCPEQQKIVHVLSKKTHAFIWLLKIFSNSQALSDHLIRDPHMFDWLNEPKTEKRIMKSDGFLEYARSFFKESSETFPMTIHNFKSRIMLFIGLRDFIEVDALTKTVELISRLADACLEMVFQQAWKEMGERFGEPLSHTGETARFAVLGLGKLGGLELNYSSDIDIIFLYSEEGQTSGKKLAIRKGEGVISNNLFFTKVSERMIQYFSDRSAGRPLFRVDMRLRPEGEAGPLVRSLESYELYYSSLGRSWEKQAFIKTRPVAGDQKLGQRFIEMIEPFVYRKYLDYKTLNDLQRIKKRIENEVKNKGQTDLHVKLGAGGIREIEFSVQMLQLLYGGKIISLRDPNTLSCLKKLKSAKLISLRELKELTDAYIFLRRVEHMLQLEEERQTHILPSKEKELAYLAKRLGFKDQASVSFSLSYGLYRKKVQQFFQRIFVEWEDKGDEERLLWMKQIDEDIDLRDDIKEKLVAVGLKDPIRALDHIRVLGQSDRELPVTSEIRNVFLSILPRLLNSLYAAWDPDGALTRFPQFVNTYNARKTFYELLGQYSHVVDLLVSLFGSGEFLSQKLMSSPDFFDRLIGEGYLVDPKPVVFDLIGKDEISFKKHLCELHNLELLKIGLRYVIRIDDVRTTTRSLSHLAQSVICASASYLKEKYKLKKEKLPRVALFGLGKLGAFELGFGSDLDLIFVYEGKPDETHGAEDFFKHLIELMSMYQIDVRLRPHGEQGTLVPSLEQCKDYYRNQSELWERMAFSRFKFIWGSEFVEHEMVQLVHNFVLRNKISDQDKREIIELKRKIKDNRLAHKRGFHTKASPGSLLDIEFLTQVLSLENPVPLTHSSSTHMQIKKLDDQGLLTHEEAHVLSVAYLFYREMECTLRLISGTKTDLLMPNANALMTLERGLGIGHDGHVIESQIQAYQNHIQEIFRRKLES